MVGREVLVHLIDILACKFCFPISRHVMVPQDFFVFKFRLMHVHMYANSLENITWSELKNNTRWKDGFQSSFLNIYFCLWALSICQNWAVSPFPSKLTIQISQILNIMHRGDSFSAKPLGQSLFYCQNVWSDHGPAGQFWLWKAPSVGCRPRSYLFTSATGPIGVQTAPKMAQKQLYDM